MLLPCFQRDKQVLSRTRTSPAWFLRDLLFHSFRTVECWVDRRSKTSFPFVSSFAHIFSNWIFVVSFFLFSCVLKLLHFLLLSYGLNGAQQRRGKKEESNENEKRRREKKGKIIYNKTWFTQNSKNTHSCLSGQKLEIFFIFCYRQNLIVAAVDRWVFLEASEVSWKSKISLHTVWVFFVTFYWFEGCAIDLINCWFKNIHNEQAGPSAARIYRWNLMNEI